MKKLLLPALYIVAALQLKAQQLPAFRSADSLFEKAVLGNFKQRPTVITLLSPQMTLAGTTPIFFESRMPIIVLDGNSKMPIIKLGGYYTMPVKRLGAAGWGESKLNVLPGLPAFAMQVK